MSTYHITSACSRISKSLRALLTADAKRYADDKLVKSMEPEEFVSKLISDLESLPKLSTDPMRKLRREYSSTLLSKEVDYVFTVAQAILDSGKHRWISYEIIRYHPHAFHSLGKNGLEALGRGINSWATVDSFSRTLSGPAWREGLISTETIHEWAKSDDRWWRRAALVSTVALNVSSRTGSTAMALGCCSAARTADRGEKPRCSKELRENCLRAEIVEQFQSNKIFSQHR